MIDRELLEMAAKAAGYSGCIYMPISRDCGALMLAGEKGGFMPWDPLNDDGDALRLAVKLGITVDTSDGVHVQYIVNHCAYTIGEYEFDDIYACTRLLIVGAAAEIGTSM